MVMSSSGTERRILISLMILTYAKIMAPKQVLAYAV
jgi:hypothetical protein